MEKQKLILGLLILLILSFCLERFFSFNLNSVSAGFFSPEKKISIENPKKDKKWEAGGTYEITWKIKEIEKVGIVLFRGKTPSWIARGILAEEKKYNWTIPAWEAFCQDCRIAIFEYPWQKGNKIDYSDYFIISNPKYPSCDVLSIETEIMHVSSDFPNLRKVFITDSKYTGNLGGLEGADQKCQEQAVKKGLAGNWKALLGDDQTIAVNRLQLNGIFIEAEPAITLPGGQRFCHRLLGENFEKFFKKFFNFSLVNQQKLEKNFLKDFSNVWLGRINETSLKKCSYIASSHPSKNISENYSSSISCQGWTLNSNRVPGYPPIGVYKPIFPQCYTAYGKLINAVGLAGLTSDKIKDKTGWEFFTPSQAIYCNESRKLLCIEQ